MNDISKVLEDISVLTQICHATNDGPTLKIEESEIKNKLAEYDQEIEDIRNADAEDSYDTSAEMADRNIEIITKKIIQAITNELKSKNTELDALKEKEEEYSNTLHSLKRTKKSYEKYIASLQERLTATTDNNVTNRYNNLIKTTEDKKSKQEERIQEVEQKHQEVQSQMDSLAEEIKTLEEKLEAKKSLLAEAQNNLQNRDVYIDKAKKEKAEKRIVDIENKKEELNQRLENIHKEPKYLEQKIRELLNDEANVSGARDYIIELLTAASKVPYADLYVDKNMEEELLQATQERDTFAQEIDNKTYDILGLVSPEQLRIDFLNERIAYWQGEIKKLEDIVAATDQDEMFHYGEKSIALEELIAKLKEETIDFKNRYEKERDSNLSNKAILKVTYEEKKADLVSAEEIASKFRKNEAEDVEAAGRIVKQDIEELKGKIKEAEDEIAQIKDRLEHRKSGYKDLSAKNKDREKLEQLAKKVIDIKHRRQFPDRTYDIAKRLETNLGIKLIDSVYTSDQKAILEKVVKVSIEEPTKEIELPKEESMENPEVSLDKAVGEIPIEENTSSVEIQTDAVEEPVKEAIETIEVKETEKTVDNKAEEIPVEDEKVETHEEEPTLESNHLFHTDTSIGGDFNISVPTNELPVIEENPVIEVESPITSEDDGNSNPIQEIIIPEQEPIDTQEPAPTSEIVIPDTPPLPDTPNDETPSIPVIPIAEPSIDDNYSFTPDEMKTTSEIDNEEGN